MPSIVIAQGGGPTAVINQTLCGAILAARRHDRPCEFWVRGMACEASRQATSAT